MLFRSYFELNTSHGYLFNPYFYAGAGLGFHWYPDAEATLMPLFIDLRTQLSNRKTVPFIDLRIGYSFDLSNSLEGQGFYFAPSAGVQFFSNKKAQLILSLGYSLQKLKLRGYYYDSWGYGHLVGDLGHVSSNGFSLKVGVVF